MHEQLVHCCYTEHAQALLHNPTCHTTDFRATKLLFHYQNNGAIIEQWAFNFMKLTVSSPALFITSHFLSIFLLNRLTIKVPSVVVVGILVTNLTLALVTSTNEFLSSQISTLQQKTSLPVSFLIENNLLKLELLNSLPLWIIPTARLKWIDHISITCSMFIPWAINNFPNLSVRNETYAFLFSTSGQTV